MGICPFEGGCNGAQFLYLMEDESGGDGNPEVPDRRVSTFWRSKDYGANDDETFNSWTDTTDPDENKVDWA